MRVSRLRVGDGERGQAPTVIVMVIALCLIAFGFAFLSRLAKAEDQMSALQTAADSSALAGAQAVARDAPSQLATAIPMRSQLQCGAGSQEARKFASRNGATVISYCYYPRRDRVEVRVRSNTAAESGKREIRSATARVGKRLGACEPPPLWPVSSASETVSCGDVDVPVAYPGGGASPVVDVMSVQSMLASLEPRLVE